MVDIEKFVEEEAGKIPQKLKPVFERATQEDIDQIMMTMSYMAYAYGKGFTEYAGRALDDWPKIELRSPADGLSRSPFDGAISQVGAE